MTTDVECDKESSTDITVIPGTPPSGSDDDQDLEYSFNLGFSPTVTHM